MVSNQVENLPTFWGNMKPPFKFRWRWLNKNLSICFSVYLTTYLSIRLSIFFDPQGWNIYAKNNPISDVDILYILYITNTCPLCSVYVIITSILYKILSYFPYPFFKWPSGETTGGNLPKRRRLHRPSTAPRSSWNHEKPWTNFQSCASIGNTKRHLDLSRDPVCCCWCLMRMTNPYFQIGNTWALIVIWGSDVVIGVWL